MCATFSGPTTAAVHWLSWPSGPLHVWSFAKRMQYGTPSSLQVGSRVHTLGTPSEKRHVWQPSYPAP